MAASTAGAPNAWFAPDATEITFSPASSTRIRAMPVAVSGSVASSETSTPEATSAARASGPNASPPTAPIIRTSAPNRAAATAWLPPLPPS